jgi:hypothetical protein
MYHLEKSIWTDQDFDQMCWHDCAIHGFATKVDLEHEQNWKSELLLDIDYIFKWVPGEQYSFWVAPCTLIFKNVYSLQLEYDTKQASIMPEFDISGITRNEHVYESGYATWIWTIKLFAGKMVFESNGYEQIVRQPPRLIPKQSFTNEERGGINFDQNPVDIE